MKKIFFLLIVISAVYNSLDGQIWEWSSNMMSDGDIIPTDMVVDQSNNVYLSGSYRNSTLTIQGDTINNFGDRDGFICKFSPTGTLLWLNRIGGTDRDFALDLEIVGTTLFVSGEYRSTQLYFTLTDFLTSTNNFDSYLASYDLDGNYLTSTRIFYGDHIDRAKGMYYDADLNNFIFIGQFQSELKYFDGSSEITIPVSGPAGKDLFIIRTNLLGEVQDTAFIRSTSTSSILKGVNKADNGAYYITGDVFGDLNFTDTDVITSNGQADIFVSKYDANLNFIWARTGGGSGFDHVNSATSDQYSNIYITGKVESTVTFDSTATLKTNPLSGFGAQDLYLAKYNRQGILQWLRRKGSIGNDNGYGLVQRENIVQFCGNISDTVIFNNDTLTSSSSSDVNTGFAVFSTRGDEIGAQGIGGLGEDVGEVITFNKTLSTIIAGYFNSTSLTIGSSDYTNSSGSYDGFIASFVYPLNATFTNVTKIKCNGETNGALTVTPYFGVGPYTYNWSHNGSLDDSTATNLGPGTYTVTITDGRDSTAMSTINLSNPPALAMGQIITDVTCHPANGASNDGAIDITVTGGTVAAGYSYYWTALSGSGVNATSEDQASLSQGLYKVLIKDDKLCSITDSFAITQPEQIAFTGSAVTGISIPPGSNGAVDLTTSGGTPGYTIDWSGPGGFTSTNEDISGLALGGTYTVEITDAASCIGDTNFLVVSDTMLIAYIQSKTNVLCKNDNTGSATVAVNNGTGPYNYNWSNGGINPTATDLVQGTYYVTVTDTDDGRTAVTSVQITEPLAELTASVVGTDLDCYQDNSGIADLTVNGGTLPYIFLWSNSGTTEDQLNLASGPYSVTVTDNKGCTANASTSLDEPAAMDINITLDQAILCNGANTGVLTATATGGVGIKTYLWNDEGSQTDQTATGLPAGIYYVTATDQSGCEVIGNRQITQPLAISLTPNVQDISCNGIMDGLINLDVSGGSPPFNYNWSNGSITQDISDLAADTYFVTVTDQYNCENSTNAIVVEPAELTFAAIETTDVTCSGNNNGQIVITGAGGIRPYEYSIDDGGAFLTDSTFSDLSVSTYTLVLRDANSCLSNSTEAILDGPEALILVSQLVVENTIVIEAGGGTPPYTYTLDGGLENSTGIFENVSDGTHTVEFVDANNCGPFVVDGILVVTGIESPDQTQFSIYPNPSEGIFNLEFNSESTNTYRIQVYSLSGEIISDELIAVQPGTGSLHKLDLNQVPPGMYILKLNGVPIKHRLIVQ